jgi:hypothetical protein
MLDVLLFFPAHHRFIMKQGWFSFSKSAAEAAHST